jgi:mannose-6-phosphate isomerase-like protein (cupin superfamily)
MTVEHLNTERKSHNIAALLPTLSCLNISDRTTEAEASNAMRILDRLNQCLVGIVNFVGQTPWERHLDDELLYILEGKVEVTILTSQTTQKVTLQAGSVFIVPRNLWHKQFASEGVKLLFVTSQEGNESSTAEVPIVK